jgi:cytochrome c nitrite reductase small subunit
MLIAPGLVAGALVGIAAGLGTYTFAYAKGSAYLTNNPEACANCHVMREQLDGWTRSSHHAVAVCNDCHTPSSLVPKYVTKARNGFWHSFYFTTGRFPEPIQISARNRAIAEGACRACHSDLTHEIDSASDERGRLSCIRCHASVGHLQ